MIRNPDPRIYFIRPVGQDGPIKVGHSADIQYRLRAYSIWSPVPLELAATMPVPDALTTRGWCRKACEHFERGFHIRYAEHRLHHEWFAAHPLILADIEAINAGTFDVGCVPIWQPKRLRSALPEYEPA